MSARWVGCLVALAVVAVGGCETDSGGEHLTVFAAASLQQVFTELGRQFEAAHPGVRVDFSFAGSADLAGQLAQGAPADVFASADTTTMHRVVDNRGINGAPRNFATNTLALVTAPGNPQHLTGLRALNRPGLQLVVCAPQVPCGAALRRTGITVHPVSAESSVTDVLGKVTSGQADAGIVYITDARSAVGKVTVVPLPEAAAAVNVYSIAVPADSPRPALARQFEDLVTGAQGRKALISAGFGMP